MLRLSWANGRFAASEVHLVDRVSPDELEPLLERVEPGYPVVDEFAAWARNQAADRSTVGQ
ncbi:hypothetical protein [Streptomyces sp. NPDC059757]|uniref:hypothetical protein n=1 Tax=Streptomyces sp. NPDC059757 TaxID=3346935 RepID=UPI003647F259